ncbi:MAG: hypothetical protein COA49_08110 [Bacteroidetes bacterium]|nr:MAG: hypothetical protein COA49_08110 [Bacteroidota bacterium]
MKFHSENLPEGMDKLEFVRAVKSQIAKDFQLDESEQEEHFEVWLNRALINDTERLRASFYRLDLPEERVAEALGLETIEESAVKLAELSIQRAEMKVITRLTFSRKDTPNRKKI